MVNLTRMHKDRMHIIDKTSAPDHSRPNYAAHQKPAKRHKDIDTDIFFN